jgi:carboxyl-terminal processing protease
MPALSAKARAAGANVTTVSGMYPVVRQLLKDLADRHSQLLDPPQARNLLDGSGTGFGLKIYPPDVIWVTPGSPSALAGIQTLDRIVSFNNKPWSRTTTADRAAETAIVVVSRAGQQLTFTMQRAEIKTAELPSIRALDNRLAYIDLPGSTGKPDDEKAYSEAGARGVGDLEATVSPCGWVLDLRRNSGGFPYSMMAPLEPFLAFQTFGGFVYGDGKREMLSFVGGELLVDKRVAWKNPTPVQLRDPNVPVAVLTSNQTGSAGEIATIAFIGRGNARSFGVPTVGVTSANVGRRMPDGGFLMVTHSYDLDRNGNLYDGPVKPDEAVALDWGTYGTPADPVLSAAKTWLGNQPACQNRQP